ncbi:hypothetical protein CEUSTIGMA_g4562.t1 [Chlamydomonas eustigma]|uniref:Glycosyltransferase 2-like domain-containing protein n=1 Tax=Chlamydomonas eustigma TaxID=1157962 RepID=A0A250X238_9CHLO|nr:hypothetical protein CEUSTIGMA_g4562.t1 [Chlamydomonas eustigma]|eukprot:GAX77116.1 hypothetical protein CEUSTIGMA_g4562.t1 [Chlamydomonas eustigma]
MDLHNVELHIPRILCTFLFSVYIAHGSNLHTLDEVFHLHPPAFCNRFENVPAKNVSSLRNLLQRIQQVKMKLTDTRLLLEWKNKVPTQENQAKLSAYRTNITEEGLRSILKSEEDKEHVYRSELQSWILQMSKSGSIPPDTTESMLSACLMGRLNTRLYPGMPQVSFMLQYFRRPWMVAPIVSALMSCTEIPSELLVNVDSQEGAQVWSDLAHNTSGFVVPVFSANQHEIRAYNRLSGLARGQVLITLQDDQVPPSGCQWIRDVMSVFGAYPSVGAVGMKVYRLTKRRDDKVEGRNVYFRDPALGLDVQFVMLVDFAPMALLRSAFRYVGGLDEGLSEPGMCGIYSDFELSARLWAAGWQVMYYPLRKEDQFGLDQSGNPSGTHRPETEYKCWHRQMSLSGAVFSQRWLGNNDLLYTHMTQVVRHLNLGLLERVKDLACPFADAIGGCDPNSNGTEALQQQG